jgi:hypothetical protein
LGAQHGKIDADLRASTVLGTPSAQLVDDYYPVALEDGGRLAPMAAELSAWLFWWQFVASLAWVLMTLDLCALTIRSYATFRSSNYFCSFSAFLGDVRREFMQRLYAAFHGNLGSYLRDAWQEGSTDGVAYLPVPRVF